MSTPLRRIMSDRAILLHAAAVLDDDAALLHNSYAIDGAIRESFVAEEHDVLRHTAAELRRIANELGRVTQ